MTNLKARLAKLAAAVAEQAALDPAFAERLEEIMTAGGGGAVSERSPPTRRGDSGRKRGRRAGAVLDPVDLAQSGPDVLRNALSPLQLPQLLDIVAEYGMDPGKLVMKWKDRDRIVERIVDTAISRATKGDAFRQIAVKPEPKRMETGMLNAQAYLIGGKSDGRGVDRRVFKLRRRYEDGSSEYYEHIDLGDGYPFVLRSVTDLLSRDDIIARLLNLGLVHSTGAR